MDNYFDLEFTSARFTVNASAETVWAVKPVQYGDETIYVNKYGFDPENPSRYLYDEYWQMSDDSRVWKHAQDIIDAQKDLVKRFPNIVNTKYRVAGDCDRILRQKADVKRAYLHIIGASKEWMCGFDAETVDGSKKFVLFLSNKSWNPDMENMDIYVDVTVFLQEVYEVNGKHVVAVHAI